MQLGVHLPTGLPIPKLPIDLPIGSGSALGSTNGTASVTGATSVVFATFPSTTGVLDWFDSYGISAYPSTNNETGISTEDVLAAAFDSLPPARTADGEFSSFSFPKGGPLVRRGVNIISRLSTTVDDMATINDQLSSGPLAPRSLALTDPARRSSVLWHCRSDFAQRDRSPSRDFGTMLLAAVLFSRSEESLLLKVDKSVSEHFVFHGLQSSIYYNSAQGAESFRFGIDGAFEVTFTNASSLFFDLFGSITKEKIAFGGYLSQPWTVANAGMDITVQDASLEFDIFPTSRSVEAYVKCAAAVATVLDAECSSVCAFSADAMFGDACAGFNITVGPADSCFDVRSRITCR